MQRLIGYSILNLNVLDKLKCTQRLLGTLT